MKKIYEISFWIRKDYEPEEIEEKILSFLKDLDLELIKKMPSKMKDLAYPINKETQAYFGTIYLYSEPNKISLLEKKLKSLSEILRFVILERKTLKLPSEQNQLKEVSKAEVEKVLKE